MDCHTMCKANPSLQDILDHEWYKKEYLSKAKNLISKKDIKNLCLHFTNVVSLDLSGCRLSSDELPSYLLLPSLKYLNLSRNQLKTVPLCLYNSLPVLEYLDLSHNLIQTFISSPACVRHLKCISLCCNNFLKFPVWFLTFRCINLVDFFCCENALRQCKIISDIYDFNTIKLSKLVLKSCSLKDAHLLFLKELRTLKHLDISNKPISQNPNYFNNLDLLFENFKWVQLETLLLRNLHLSALPQKCTVVMSLKWLDLSGNNISWLPDEIEKLSNLQYLDISNSSMLMLPKNTENLNSLKCLRAAYNSIDVVHSIPRNLEFLDLYSNNIDLISCNINEVNCDIEYNYIDLSHDESYKTGMRKLRKQFNVEDRKECVKIKENCEESSESSSSESEYASEGDDSYSQNASVDNGNNENFVTEDWDVVEHIRNPDIDSIDNEWKGESRRFILGSKKAFDKDSSDEEFFVDEQ